VAFYLFYSATPISDKIFDFSYDTIDQLIKKGIDDALEKVFEVEKEKNNNNSKCITWNNYE
jgi:DNA-binding protein YbaB